MTKTKITILGCGSSLGVPRIDGFWGRVNKANIKNHRTRCSIFIKYNNLNLLIDTSPDLKSQLLKNKISNIDGVIISHDHADQTHGINELRPFFWKNQKKIPLYCDQRTFKVLYKSFSYLFRTIDTFYKPILEKKIFKDFFFIKKKNTKILFKVIKVKHGNIYANGLRFNDIAYISDCSHLSLKNLKDLKKIKLLIIDCLKFKKHKTHLNYNEALKYIKILKPKKTLLTNLHSDLDYNLLKKKVERYKNIKPAYDGLQVWI